MNNATPELLSRLGQILKERWGLDCTAVKPIKVRENAVFAVHLQGGERAVLRVHRRGYHSDAALSSECMWMQALAEHGIDVPRHVPSKAGTPFESLPVEGFDGVRQLDVFHWIEGQQLGSIEQGVNTAAGSVADAYRQLGKLAAKVHNHSSGWQRPGNFDRHAWDAAGLAGNTPFWGRFWELESPPV